jgi:hydroxymethylglutaryl-CoA lyase
MMVRDIELCEVGPRDGFQYEAKILPTDTKLALISRLADAGLPRIQVASFVHPKRVPQMADAEDVVANLPSGRDVIFSGLALNVRGVERAAAAGLRYVDLSIATNEQHSRDNANMSVAEGISQAEKMVDLALASGLQTQLNLQTVFGYRAPGDTSLRFILELADIFAGKGLESFSLADTTGMANPAMIRDTARAVQDIMGDVPLVLHLHDTRGVGLANVYAAIQEGVRRFDTSFGGLGGCPFVPGATGNIATEDTAYMLDAIGMATGVDALAVARTALEAERALGRNLPGRLTALARIGADITLPTNCGRE